MSKPKLTSAYILTTGRVEATLRFEMDAEAKGEWRKWRPEGNSADK